MRELLATTAALALVVATPALAQTPVENPQPAPGNAAATQQDEESEGAVVVTARRRDEAIRDVPGTITAVTGAQLEARGPLVSAGDLFASVPGVRFNGLSSENLAEVSIRGSGTQRATSADSGVGLFFNGAYVGSSSLGGRNFKAVDYFDVERVEVLEGPQGGLYGRNSEFGVTHIIPVKPKFTDSGYISDRYTFDLGQNRLSAVLNAALDEETAGRVGFEIFNQSEGFNYDPKNDDYYDQTKGWTGRAQFRHRSGPLDVTFMVDGQDLELPTFINVYNVPGGGVNPAFPLGFSQPRFSQSREGDAGLQQKSVRAILSASYDFGGVVLESTSMTTSWRSTQQFGAAIDFATLSRLRAAGQLGIYPFAQTTTDVRDTTYYQDLHLSGGTDAERFAWIIGVEGLYQDDDYQRTAATSPCAFTLAASICTGTPTVPVCLRPLPTSPACPAVFPLTFGVESYTQQKTGSLATYASLEYSVGDLNIVGEARYSSDEKTADQTNYRLYTTTLSSTPSSFDFSASEWTWTLMSSYELPAFEHTLVYGKVGTGYRAGGVNNGTFNAAAPNPFAQTYGNEHTIGYEVGLKTNITRDIFFRLSAYLSETQDAITSINDGCAPTNACGSLQQFFNINGGTIRAEGVEASLDARFRAAGGLLSIGLNAANQSAKFDEVPAGGGGLPLRGTPVAQIPDWTMSATLDYRRPIGADVTAFGNLSYSGQRGGGQDTVTVATPFIALDDFDLFAARFGVDVGKIQFAVFGRNITDESIQVLKFYQAGQPLAARWNQPRSIGVSASYRW